MRAARRSWASLPPLARHLDRLIFGDLPVLPFPTGWQLQPPRQFAPTRSFTFEFVGFFEQVLREDFVARLDALGAKIEARQAGDGGASPQPGASSQLAFSA